MLLLQKIRLNMKQGIVTLTVIIMLMVFGGRATGQVKLYDPELDGMKQLNEAIASAKAANKHVFVQIGGNWCVWCIKFDAFCKEDAEITKLINDNYITVKLNFSPENRNEAATKFIGGNPGRFGYPVFVILGTDGKRIHTQDSALLEQGDGYSKAKVVSFLKGWTIDAVK